MICPHCQLNNPPDSLFCQYCGVKLDVPPQPAEPTEPAVPSADTVAVPVCDTLPPTPAPPPLTVTRPANPTKDGFCTAMGIPCLVFTAIGIISVILAFFAQDPLRDMYEGISPSIQYLIIEVVSVAYLVPLLFAVLCNKRLLQSILGVLPVLLLFFILLSTEGAIDGIFSRYSRLYSYAYANRDAVDVLNAVWLITAMLTALFNLILWCCLLIRRCRYNHYHSIRYREKCYRRIAKIQTYRQAGIISQEEFEETRRRIMEKIR